MNKMIRQKSNDVNEAYTLTLDVILTVVQIHALVRRITWGLGRIENAQNALWTVII